MTFERINCAVQQKKISTTWGQKMIILLVMNNIEAQIKHKGHVPTLLIVTD